MKAVIIGCGNIAGGYDQRNPGKQVLTHAKAFQSFPEILLAGAVDSDPAQAQGFGQIWHVPLVGTQLEAILDRVQPEIVSVCSPNSTHSSVLRKALEYGPKAILCEKPLALEVSEATEMVENCRKKGVLLAVNYLRRWDDSIRALGTRIVGGDFGDLQTGRVLFTKGVFHNASHGINLLVAWFGRVNQAKVLGKAERLADGDFRASFTLFFKKGQEVVFQSHDVSHFNFFEIDLIFTKARVTLPWHGQGISVVRTQPSPVVSGEKILAPSGEVIPGTLGTAMKNLVGNVLETLGGKARLLMEPEDALETVRVCDQIRRSANE